MKKRRITTLPALAVCLVLIGSTLVSGESAVATDDDEAMTAARELMLGAGLCTLVTLDETGHPQARIMDPFPPEEDLTVWMATNVSTRKVAQLDADNRATLVYFDPGAVGYVTLLGTAEVIRDPAEKAKHWKPEWADFYQDAHRGADFVLVRFEPHRAEVVSLGHGVAAGPREWRPAIVEF